MANLSIEPATGQQTATQNPQAVPTQTVGASTQSGGVQPGTDRSLLTSPNGVSLNATPLTTVSLDTGTQVESQPAALPAHHHANPVFFSVSIILCVIAIGLFWATTRSAKNTTK